MKVREIGEFALIERLARRMASLASPQAGAPPALLLGIGDDAAAWRAEGVMLATTDSLVEGIHFLPEVAPWRAVGWKALAVNASDIAAMGGVPCYGLVTLGLPPDLPVTTVDELYEGLAEACQEWGLTIAGGDIVRAPLLFITVALWGEAREGRLLTRSGASRGDLIAVTGTLGEAAAGLALLRRGQRQGPLREGPKARVGRVLVEAQLRPRPPLSAGPLAARLGVAAGIDISDGLLQDLGHICRASGVAAVVEAACVPASAALQEAFPEEALRLACTGGEDYQLLLTASAPVLEEMKRRSPVPLTVIGHIQAGEPGRVRLVDEEGQEVTFARAGWDHLQGGP